MTQAESRTLVRQAIDQTDTTNTEFSNDAIDDAVDFSRRALARILPAEFMPNLEAEGLVLDVVSGRAAYPADYMRRKENKEVLVDVVVATEIKKGDEWLLRHLQSNEHIDDSFEVYYRELGSQGIQVYPAGSAKVTSFPYIKYPGTLDGSNNTDLPKDIEDMSIDLAVEKLMRYPQGNLDIALRLAQDRGYRIREMMK
jgi:hypothetical protein